jgi:2Fe-2S ferredoxin
MCKVTVADQAGLSAPNGNEKMKLGGLERQGVRLACQAKVTGSVIVEVPEDPLKAAIRKQLDKPNGDSLWD